MKGIFSILLLICPFVYGQSLADADRMFDRFEYAQAAKTYEEIAKGRKLDVESRKKLAYSYYTIGEYKKCFPVVDSLVRYSAVEPFFFYIHGNSAMAVENYDVAKASFEKYKSKDDEFNVSVLIQSCDSLKVWKNDESIIVQGIEGNISKADINGSKYREGYFLFREMALDSLGTEMTMASVDLGELMITQPIFVNKEGVSNRITLPEEFRQSAVTSASLLNGEGLFILTIAEPASANEAKRAPHLYLAKFDDSNFSFSDIQPWNYSGFEDSTGCAYASVNSRGDQMVFTKIGKRTKGSDLYLSTLSNGSWSKPVALNDLNTVFDEIAPMFIGDTLLSFSSNGRPGYGSLDIFTAQVNENGFGNIVHLKAPLNSFSDDFNYSLINDTTMYFTSNRASGIGDDDVYSYTLPRKIEPIVDTVSELDVFLANWQDQRIYFDFDKFTIRDQKVIEEIAAALIKFDGLQIVIEGHTDIRGKEIYNLELGKQRAQAVNNEFVKLGVNSSNVNVVSKGESDLQVDCSKGCTEEQHQQNRVAIIKIKK